MTADAVPSSDPALAAAHVTQKPFTMLGDPTAEACEGDACLIPAQRPETSTTQD